MKYLFGNPFVIPVLMKKSHDIIAIGTLEDQEIQAILRKENSFSDIFDIIINNKIEGQVQKLTGQWHVCPRIGSYLTKFNSDFILRAVLNFEDPNL